MIISDPSSSYQKNPRKYPNAHMLQPNSFILLMYFSKKNSTRTTPEFQLYYNFHDYACYVTRMRLGNMYNFVG